jgi:DtxR family Mn-dependent transcriptional regulator
MELSESIENYLKTIYSLEEAQIPATTVTLAEWLGVKPPSITGMIKRLAERKLLRHRPYHGVALTAAGRRRARAIMRRHRLIELFLVRVLRFAPNEVHEEAERWEHVVSAAALERIDIALGRPSHDPHGKPIPAATE